MLNTNYGRSSAVCIVGHNYGDYYYFIPILSFAFAPFCFPCSFIPRCPCRFFGFLFGGLFFIDASRNQTGYIHKGILVGFDTVVSCDKRGYIVCKLIVDKERIHVFFTQQQYGFRCTHAEFILVTFLIIVCESQLDSIQCVV